MNYLLYTIIFLLAILIVCVIMLLARNQSFNEAQITRDINASTVSAIKELGSIITQNQKDVNKIQTEKFSQIDRSITGMQKRVSEQLENVYGKFGQMQAMADGVNDLRNILSNVKTRGILGELSLGAILDEILAPEQFDTNVATIPKSANRVEFAIRLPHDDTGLVYLPIDSKFPLDAYTSLNDAYEDGDVERISQCKKLLISRMKLFARDIRQKYVEPPYTTDFAIMYLPIEGLYAESLRLGMVEELQREYKINIAGPSTMAAMLNALLMGFKTLALEKKSSEVWEILSSVRAEFEKFDAALETAKKHIAQAEGDLEALVGTRTRAIIKKLDALEK